jgi:hypothetical protein
MTSNVEPPSKDADLAEWTAFWRIVGWCTLVSAWLLWPMTLPVAALMYLAFDSNVSIRDGLLLGVIQATWVSGVPMALIVGRHLGGHGWTMPQWRVRWFAVGALVLLSCLIVALWILLSATDCSNC